MTAGHFGNELTLRPWIQTVSQQDALAEAGAIEIDE
jgi:hypothetical protein